MNECELSPGQNCPYDTRISVLETKVKYLEEERSEQKAFRKAFYEDQKNRAQRDERLDAQVNRMEEKLDEQKKDVAEKLDTLLAWRKEELDKPNKLLDGLIEKAVWAVGAALIAVLLSKLGVV